ncbi:MAG: penicillin-binding protein activator [Rhodobacteraceae bacterium]|nr:MAG: penicillin-binding protein activator [Paracoccaceae bacterium]
MRRPPLVSPVLTRRGLLSSAAATVFVAGCEAPAVLPGVGTGPETDPSGPARVALLVPGGGESDRQTLARNLENAARMARADLQGVEMDLRVYQTGGEPQRAASEASRAISDGAQIILGPLFADATRAVAPVAAEAGVNVLSFSNNPDVAGGNVFLLGAMFENTATRLLGYAAGQGRGSVMIVSEQSEAGRIAEQAIQRAATRTGATIAGTQSYAFSQQGIVDALPQISSTARNSGADSIIFTAGSEGALPLLAELLPQNSISNEDYQFMGLTRWDIPPATMELSGLQGGWFALPDPRLNEQFERRYEAAHGSRPNPVAALGYDGVAAVGALARLGGSAPFSAQAITQQSGFAGVAGVFRFRRDGTNERGLAVAEIRDERREILSPAPRSFVGGGS